MKKVAFIITVYKKEQVIFFKQSIDSIVNQDYGFENINIYLGIDGELTNELNNYIESYQNYFHKIVRNDSNQGLAYTLNRLIEVLEDEVYIFRMDSDDICTLHRVSRQVQFLNSNDDIMVVGSDLIEINEQGEEIRKKKMPVGYENIVNYAIARSPLNHPTVAFRKDFFKKIGLYNEQFVKAQDYELWSRALIRSVRIENIPEPLLYFRVASNYMSKRNSKANYFNEFKVSIKLMEYFKKYTKFPIIIVKLMIRLMPSSIGNWFYKISRK